MRKFLATSLLILPLISTQSQARRDDGADYEQMQRSLIKASAEKEVCKTKKCGDRPSIFNLFEHDKNYSKRISDIKKYNQCVQECDVKAVPVPVERYETLSKSVVFCENHLPDAYREF